MYVNGRTGKEGLEKSVGQGARVCIYHLLGAAFGQGVAITQVIDLDVLDEITVLLVNIDIEGTTIAGRGRLGPTGSDTRGIGLAKNCQRISSRTVFLPGQERAGPYCTNRRDVDMLRGLFLAQLRINARCCLGGRSCRVPLGTRSLGTLRDRTATTCCALTVAMRRRA
jgi:hypothetical protein